MVKLRCRISQYITSDITIFPLVSFGVLVSYILIWACFYSWFLVDHFRFGSVYDEKAYQETATDITAQSEQALLQEHSQIERPLAFAKEIFNNNDLSGTSH